MAVIVSEDEAAERLDELIDRVLDGEDVLVLASGGDAVRLVPIADETSPEVGAPRHDLADSSD